MNKNKQKCCYTSARVAGAGILHGACNIQDATPPDTHFMHHPPLILLEDKECIPANSLVSHSVKTPFAPQGWFFAVALAGFYTTGVSKQYLLKIYKYILCFTE